MLSLEEFMNRWHVSNKRYVDIWIDKGLIPGAVRDKQTKTYSFPDSARRPYQGPGLKPALSADKIRAHIVKAAIERKYISAPICYTSEDEFQVYVNQLVKANLIETGVEDGIVYINSTLNSSAYSKKHLNEIHSFIEHGKEGPADDSARIIGFPVKRAPFDSVSFAFV